ISD
ncbi:hypothetical protein D029_2480, partial [Vibrio parahaemolyticus 970107]